MLASKHCLDCGTELSQERWSGGLCPRCLLVMALEESPSSGPDRLTEAPTLAFPPTTIAPGEIPGDRYRIHSLLGRGGMGEVWRAFDLKLRVDVALKALRRELLEDNHALELLRQEVRAAREVVSPNVCRVFDLEELDGQELVSMEYIDGTTLLEILKERGPLELEEAREIASQFLAGLEAIHLAGLVHRDVKPENIMLTRSGRVVVMDFGVAKRLADSIGSVAGTPAYMAPEQIKGQAIDARADVFSAGVVLAEMIAPEGIGSSEARENLWRGIHHDPPELPESPWLGVLKKAVTPSLEERYASASVLARALEEVTLRIEGAEEVQPYPGLAAFTEEDAEYFFGRELEVEEMWKKLRRPHLLALIGPSGAGKSSFLRAGLIPTIPEGWRVVISTPGNRPFRALAQRLVPEFEGDTDAMTALLDLEEMEVAVPLVARWRERHKQALVIVDQFEELFTQNPVEVQGRFAELLGRLALEADVHVLLSMRDDFLMYCHQYQPLKPIFSELTPLDPPTGAALRRAVVQPALKCGYRFEDEALVDEILGEVEEERGALPMLAFAASRLWSKRERDSGLLTREAYGEIGGVSGSLAQHAEATLERIGSQRIPIVREIFRNLVTAQGTRAARDRDELLSVFGAAETAGTEAGRFDGGGTTESIDAESALKRPGSVPAGVGGGREAATQVLNTLIDARLLTSYEVPPAEEEDTGHRRIEIIHESLLTAWPRLVRWQSQDADSALLRDELRQAAQTWEQHERADDLLWAGTAFREYQLWRERYPGGLSELEEEFSRAMTGHAQRRKRRRRIALAAAFAVLLTVVAVVSVSRQQALAEARRAEAAKLLALGQLELEDFPTAAVAYALKSLELHDDPATRRFALEALWRGPTALLMEAYQEDGLESMSLDFSPNGEWLAVGGYRRVQLRSSEGGPAQFLAEHQIAGQAAVTVGFGPRSDLLASNKSGDVRFSSIPGGEELGRRRLEEGPSNILLRGDGFFTLTTEGEEEVVRWWSLDGEETRLVGRMGAIGPGDIDRTGTWLAYCSDSRPREVYLRSLEEWNTPPRLVGEHPHEVRDLGFHPDGDRIAASDASGEIRVWSMDPGSKDPLRVLQGKGLRGLRFHPSGTRLVAYGSPEGQSAVGLWDLTGPPDAEPMLLLKADTSFVNHVAFDPSGRWLASANATDVALWNLDSPRPRVLTGHTGMVYDLTFTPDGTQLLSVSKDGTVRAWSLEGEGEPSRVVFRAPFRFPQIDIDPAGRRLIVVGKRTSEVDVLSMEGGDAQAFGDFSPSSTIWPATFDPEGRLAAAASLWGPAEEKVIRVWDLESGESRILGPVEGAGEGFESGFWELQFMPDGRLVSCAQDGIRRWNLEESSAEVLSREQCMNMAVSRDGRYLLHANLDSADKTRLFLSDLVEGTSTYLASHGTAVGPVALDPTETFVVTGSGEGVVRVGPVTGEEPHLLLGHEMGVGEVAVSPDGQWISSAGFDHTIRLWPMPDMDKPPFHTLPYEELLAKLRSLTNLRVVEDEESATGYKLEPGPFPGWDEVPTW